LIIAIRKVVKSVTFYIGNGVAMEAILELLILIGIGSIIGWITNYIAIKLVFRPYKEINILGFKLQGLIPKRRGEIAKNVAMTIDKELISIKDITKAINSMELEQEIDKIVESIVEDKLKHAIVEKFPMASMFLSESLMGKIKSYVKEAIEENKEEFIEIVIKKIESEIDIKDIIIEKAEEFPLEKHEKIVMEIAKTELRHIEVIGGILGGLIGLVQFVLTRFI
jgi:uncharacterized membrane protein YheB (UPF0754 family)